MYYINALGTTFTFLGFNTEINEQINVTQSKFVLLTIEKIKQVSANYQRYSQQYANIIVN